MATTSRNTGNTDCTAVRIIGKVKVEAEKVGLFHSQNQYTVLVVVKVLYKFNLKLVFMLQYSNAKWIKTCNHKNCSNCADNFDIRVYK